MKYTLLTILLLILFSTVYAQQNIRIGLYQDMLPESMVIHCISGEYLIETENNDKYFREGELLYISLIKDSLLLSDGDLNYGFFHKIYFRDSHGNGVFKIRPIDPSGDSRDYEGDLEISINHKALQAVNIIEFDKYLAGVVEAEGGPSAHPEYYKVQSILSRTYALKNFNNHKSEGFNLCDNTHCQVYKGRSESNPSILHAVLSTHNLVLTGRYFVLINTVYHSNSGGETRRASDVWTNDEEYFQAVMDPFSIDQPNYKWEKSISLDMWRNYLISSGIRNMNKIDNNKLLIRQEHRKKYYNIEKDSVNIDKVRNDFNLRSGFFSMEQKGDSVVFKGKGYGHGIGLSQEGAMEMARQGFSFSDILRFYYHQVQIRDILNIPDEQLPEEFRGIR